MASDNELKLKASLEGGTDVFKPLIAQLAALSSSINQLNNLRQNSSNSAKKLTDAEIAQKEALKKTKAEYDNLSVSVKQLDYLHRQENISLEQVLRNLNEVDTKSKQLNLTNKQRVDLEAQIYQVEQRAINGFTSMSKSLGDVNSQLQRTNPLMISMNQVVQDMPFGLRGIGNNLQFATQQFVQLRSSGMSTKEILGGMLANVFTPMGALMMGVSVATSGLTMVMDKLGSKSKEVEQKQKDLNREFQNQSDILYDLGELTKNQRIRDLEMPIAQGLAELEKLSVSEKDFNATVLARTKDPNAIAVYKTVGTPKQIEEVTNKINAARAELKKFIDDVLKKESKGVPLRDAVTGLLDVGFKSGPMSKLSDKPESVENIFRIKPQTAKEWLDWQQEVADLRFKIIEDGLKDTEKSEDKSLRNTMNLYNSLFFDPIRAGFDAVINKSGSFADAFVGALKKMIVQLLQFAIIAGALSIFLPGAGFASIFGSLTGIGGALPTEVTKKRSISGGISNRMVNNMSMGASANTLRIVGETKLKNDHILVSYRRAETIRGAVRV